MAKFTILFHYDVIGAMEVDAEDLEDAESRVLTILAEEGVEDEADCDITGRDYDTHGERINFIKEHSNA